MRRQIDSASWLMVRHLVPDLTNVKVAVARTLPSYKGRQEVREVLMLYKDAVLAARKHIYVENQYLTSASITDILTRRLKQEHGPEIVIVLPRFAGGWLEQSTMEAIQGRILGHLFEADHRNRLRVYYPDLGSKDISLKVHAKVMVVDNALARVGSANLSNRSMGLDSECDLAVDLAGDPRIEKGIALFRNRLLAEHLNSSPQAVEENLKETGSLIMTIENLSGRDRTLKPLDFQQQLPINGPALFGDPTLFDPEQPIKLDQMIDQFVLEEGNSSRKYHLVKAASLLLILLALAAAWRWTPLSQWLGMDRLTGWATSIESIEGGYFSLLAVVGAYVAGGILMVPVTLLVAVTATVFDPIHGIIYALIGCLSSALLSYGIGRKLGKKTIRRIAGQRLNRLSRRLANQQMLTIALVRNLPIAPFTIVNMVSGAARITLKDYLVGTALGMLPGIVAIVLFTDRLIAAFKKPHWTNIAFAAGLALCLGIAIWWTKKRISRETDK